VTKLEIEPLTSDATLRRPFLIAGPCSAETEAQVLQTAKQVAPLGVAYFRAGIWKPRTRPNHFEGIGDEGLAWLGRARAEHGVALITEVATPQHVEQVLAHGIDAVWIGARTAVSPFAVQEIADALAGVDIPVFVKNPINPDVGLWIGAIERMHAVGIRRLAAIHRGFSTADRSRFRNKPMWELAVELRRLLPNLPILNDPSHIAGSRDLVQDVAQRAMDMGLDGLMIETHPSPDDAWSDAAQQVTPKRLAEILGNLKLRSQSTTDAEYLDSVTDLREEIDRIDAELLETLATRMQVVEQIARLKRAENVTSLQMSRWEEILRDRQERAAELGLDPAYVKDVYDAIHEAALLRLSDVMNRRPRPDRTDDVA